MHGEFRRALLRHFPYAIYFRVRSAIEIFAVFHARRDPRDLRARDQWKSSVVRADEHPPQTLRIAVQIWTWVRPRTEARGRSVNLADGLGVAAGAVSSQNVAPHAPAAHTSVRTVTFAAPASILCHRL